MSNYRRSKSGGGAYFFTVVTYRSRPIFKSTEYIKHLEDAILDVRCKHPFKIDAWVLLPDRMHCIWSLPEKDADYSRRWGLIKAGFSKRTRDLLSVEKRSPSRIRHRETSIWQRRFWEHEIRNEKDLNNHIEYIHYNPVKHGLVERVKDWPYSTFHRYVMKGVYHIDWGDDGLDELKQDYRE